ncbi:MAG: hypothetical protein O9301_16180 [Leptospira sp.]|nr:hypothetical protein [Leptospira sp.]
MNWKELLTLSEEELMDQNLVSEFNLVGHPEFPNISELDPRETLELLTEFLEAENQIVSIQNLLNYAPFIEIMLIRKNLPSIYG